MVQDTKRAMKTQLHTSQRLVLTGHQIMIWLHFEWHILTWLQGEYVTKCSVINSLFPPTIHPTGTWYRQLSHSRSSSFTPVSPSNSSEKFLFIQMDALAVPADRHKGWYLSLMAPNTKGPVFAWLDPSRLYCNNQVWWEKRWFLFPRQPVELLVLFSTVFPFTKTQYETYL